VVDLHRGLAIWDFSLAVEAGEILLAATPDAPPLMDPEILLEMVALANMKTGRLDRARRAMDAWAGLQESDVGRIRHLILDATLRAQES
jgi:hypothetical protein